MRLQRAITGTATSLAAVLILVAAAPAQTARVRIEIEGIDGALLDNARAFLTLADAAQEAGRLSPDRIRRLHDLAPGQIKRSLEPFGYYKAEVSSQLVPGDSVWVAHYRVKPGPAIYVDSLDVRLVGEGRNEGRLQEAIEDFPLDRDDVLLHGEYELGKAQIQTLAIELGYLDATYDTSQIRVDLDAYESAIILVLNTGPLHYFGDITFEQDVLDQDVLRDLVPIRAGQRYNSGKLLELQANLVGSPYFSRAEVRPGLDTPQGTRIPIHVTLEPESRRHFEFGAGYGTDTGFRGRAGMELRRLNRGGHRAQADIQASTVEWGGTARYMIPRPFLGIDLGSVFAGYQHLAPDPSTSDRIRVGVGLNDDVFDWRQSHSLAFEHESFEVGPDTATSDLLIAETSWRQSKANDVVFTTRGWELNATLKGAHDALFSSTSFAQMRSSGTLIRSLTERTRVIGRAELGITMTPDFRSLPASLRFFAGGDESVRGYSYQSLGPRDADGNPIGGDVLITSSLELEQRILERWGIAAFLDAGNALDGFSLDLEEGAGLGLRWISPIGQVRLDGAFAISEPGTPFRLHLRVGPSL